ncbi:MAG TPA: hypothetical protein VF472_25325 [Burkholderiaceae bacterium]
MVRLLLSLAFAAAGVAVCAAVALTVRTDDVMPPTRAARPAGRDDVFGPGILQTDFAASSPSSSVLSPPDEASVDGRGNLIIDTALLRLLDYFLLQQADDGLADLEHYLNTALPEPARHQAIDIARRYCAYMAEHDSQLAEQHAGLRDLPRVSAWMAQRARLRASTIGEDAAKAWYQNDDAQLQQAVFELSGAQGTPGAEEASPQGEGVPHWQSPDAAARHLRYLQQIVERNLLSYAARKTLSRHFAAHFQEFAEAAKAIDNKAGGPDRQKQVALLEDRFFPTTFEKELAESRLEVSR